MLATPSAMVPLGTPAPTFSLTDPDGMTWTFDRIAGRYGTVVVFAANDCPFVTHIAGRIGALAAQWRQAGVGIVGINSVEPAKSGWRWTFPYLTDAGQVVARHCGATCTPDFFLYDSGRTLVYRGRFDAAVPGNGVPVTGDELAAAVQAMRDGEEIVDIGQLPSQGCPIP